MGFPCTDISVGPPAKLLRIRCRFPPLVVHARGCNVVQVAGGRAGLNGRYSSLYHEGVRLAVECQCSWMVMENVSNLIGRQMEHTFAEVLDACTRAGFNRVHWTVLSAACGGSPQLRKRWFAIAGKDGVPPVPPRTHVALGAIPCGSCLPTGQLCELHGRMFKPRPSLQPMSCEEQEMLAASWPAPPPVDEWLCDRCDYSPQRLKMLGNIVVPPQAVAALGLLARVVRTCLSLGT